MTNDQMNIRWDGQITGKLYRHFNWLEWREWNAYLDENCLLILATSLGAHWAKCKMEVGG